MPGPISIGDEAPNFDLSSTEDALLMLKDEVSRSAAVVYFFADPADERSLRDLDALNRRLDKLTGLFAKVMAVSPAKLDDLRKLQMERKLLFPLLHDDRNFSAAYGVAAPAAPAAPANPEAPQSARPAAPALVVVSRRQRILWLANPVASVEEAMPQVEKVLGDQPSPAKAYPKSVVNRFIDRLVS